VLPATTAGLGSAGFYGKALLGLGGDLLQGYFANRGANKAADELNKSADKQIALYDKALGPYMDPGPLNIMKGLAGIPVAGAFNGGTTGGSPVPGQFDANRLDNPTTGRTAPETAIPMGTAAPRGGTLAALAPRAMAQQQTQSSFVRMRDPRTGEVGEVHPSRVREALQAGAEELS